VDEEGRIRLDDWEMMPEVQAEVRRRWEAVNTDNLDELSAMGEYRAETLALCGFGVPGVDYTQPTNPVLEIPNVIIA
jgi:enoyl-[acyl-carrier protein] reductase/trans-2-enoyl-CoA reductase (NAD+)